MEFSQTAPTNSELFLPDGYKTLLHLIDSSWQPHFDQHLCLFPIYLEKHGSHAKGDTAGELGFLAS